MADEADLFVSLEAFSQQEPDTQQLYSQYTPVELLDGDDTMDESTWGWLYPAANSSLEALALKNDFYTFGRSPKCNVIFDDQNVSDNLLLAISKNHFKILKEPLSSETEVVHLEDLSMNGTFVNKNKIGKGKKVILNNNDEIALANPHNKVYIFVDTSLNKNWIPPDMKKTYSVMSPLGSGAYGEVKLAQDKITGKLVAIKKIAKREGKEGNTFNEVRILQNLKHPCVVTMENVFDTSDSLYIVLEYINGGELAMRIKEATKLSDAEAKCIFYQLVLALQYLHRKGVAHRDLKPENVLLMNNMNKNSNERLVKVSDFGLSKLIDSKTDLKTFCGTPMYTAPEILMTQGTGSYTHQVDVWSLGVILFLCVSGKLPFNKARSPLPVLEQIVRASYSMSGQSGGRLASGCQSHSVPVTVVSGKLPFNKARSPLPVMEQIVRASYSMSGPEWRGVSPQAASLIRRMLKADPNQRITIEGILSHPWLQDDDMKLKVGLLMKNTAPCGDENLYIEITRPAKRRRMDDDDNTVMKS